MRLAVFDLDGTITRHDTLWPYVLGFLRQRPWMLPRLLGVLGRLLQFAVGLTDHGQLKQTLIRCTLRGRTRAELDAWTERFIADLIAGGMHADALRTIEQHRSEGDVLVLMSASPDLYVPAIAARLGFGEWICTQLRWQGDRLEGSLITPNRRGAEKARCFEALRQRYATLATLAYGNAASDIDHLRLADAGLLVNAPAAARRRAAACGVTVGEWR